MSVYQLALWETFIYFFLSKWFSMSNGSPKSILLMRLKEILSISDTRKFLLWSNLKMSRSMAYPDIGFIILLILLQYGTTPVISLSRSFDESHSNRPLYDYSGSEFSTGYSCHRAYQPLNLCPFNMWYLRNVWCYSATAIHRSPSLYVCVSG